MCSAVGRRPLTEGREDRGVKGCEALGIVRGPREPHRNPHSVPIASMILGGGEEGEVALADDGPRPGLPMVGWGHVCAPIPRC